MMSRMNGDHLAQKADSYLESFQAAKSTETGIYTVYDDG